MTSAGVFISRSMNGIIAIPSAVNTAPITSVITIAVCTVSCTLSYRFAP